MRAILFRLLKGVFVPAICIAAFGTAGAQDRYPHRPIQLIIGIPAGGPTDVQTRALALAVSKELGQPVVVVNKPGVAGTLGPSQMAASSAPDGYTLSVLLSTLMTLPHTNPQSMRFDPRTDFTWIAKITNYSFAVMVRADSPYKSMQQLLDHARANPGKVAYGHSGVGGATHSSVEKLSKAAGVRFNDIPYAGGTPIYQALMGGFIEFAATAGFGPFLQDSRFRLLAVMTETRLPTRPDIPTLKELKLEGTPDVWWGIGGPKRMDPSIVATLTAAFQKAARDPGFLRTLEMDDQTVNWANGPELNAMITRLYAQEELNARELGLKKQ